MGQTSCVPKSEAMRRVEVKSMTMGSSLAF